MSSKTTLSQMGDPADLADQRSVQQPLRQDLRWLYIFSLLIVVFTAVAAAAGILYADRLYPTEEMRQNALANDVLTLIIGLPIIGISLWLTWRGKLIGLLIWPGAILYGLYNYLIYLFGITFNVMYPLYLIIVTLSIYTTMGLVASIDSVLVKQRLNGRVPEKLGGGLLLVFGILFMLRSLVEMGTALSDQTSLAGFDLGLLITDFIISAAWVVCGWFLWRRRPLGYVGGIGFLFQVSMLFVGVLAVVLLQPYLSESAFLLGDFIVLFVMALIFFVPFGIFVRGVIRS